MSRKPPSDKYTRFTSNTPSFSSNTPSFSSNPKPPPAQATPTSTLPNETPAQRVARLRAQNAARRAAALSPADRLLTRGRHLADTLHRITTYSLLGFSAVAAVIATYGMFSLVSHNRTQKRAWIEREMSRLDEARRAFLEGRADAEQLHLLEMERAGEELKGVWQDEKRRKKEEGVWGRLKGTFLSSGDKGREDVQDEAARFGPGGARIVEELETAQSGLRGDIERGRIPSARHVQVGSDTVELRPAAVQESGIAGVGLDEKGRPVPLGKMNQVRVGDGGARVDTDDSVVVVKTPGQFDVLADNIASATTGNGPRWWSWASGGKS